MVREVADGVNCGVTSRDLWATRVDGPVRSTARDVAARMSFSVPIIGGSRAQSPLWLPVGHSDVISPLHGWERTDTRSVSLKEGCFHGTAMVSCGHTGYAPARLDLEKRRFVMADVRFKWLSHAGFAITSPEGKTVIIDPWISENPLCPVKVDDVTAADIVLVTHDHFDHIANAADIVKKTGAILVAVPETASKLQSEMGVAAENVVFGGYGMNVGGRAEVKGIGITMTQAFHSSATGCPVGYIVEFENGNIVYHAGDTGIFDSMKLVGDLYNIDVALLPVGGVFTMDPFQASKALPMLRPKVVIPMHYKTFPILEQDASRFVTLAKEEYPEATVVALEPGGEYTF